MNVVGHDAKGMEGEVLLSGNFQEMMEQPSAGRLISKERRALLRSHSYEINEATAIVVRWTPQALLKKGHTLRLGPANASREGAVRAAP